MTRTKISRVIVYDAKSGVSLLPKYNTLGNFWGNLPRQKNTGGGPLSKPRGHQGLGVPEISPGPEDFLIFTPPKRGLKR